MANKNDGGPAFPISQEESRGKVAGIYGGMTLRDYFAAKIANGLASHSGTMGDPYGPDDIASRSYQVADAMLAEREK